MRYVRNNVQDPVAGERFLGRGTALCELRNHMGKPAWSAGWLSGESRGPYVNKLVSQDEIIPGDRGITASGAELNNRVIEKGAVSHVARISKKRETCLRTWQLAFADNSSWATTHTLEPLWAITTVRTPHGLEAPGDMSDVDQSIAGHRSECARHVRRRPSRAGWNRPMGHTDKTGGARRPAVEQVGHRGIWSIPGRASRRKAGGKGHSAPDSLRSKRGLSRNMAVFHNLKSSPRLMNSVRPGPSIELGSTPGRQPSDHAGRSRT